jgi:response regulator RpfG family c-di-GMP phosphodiesterase
MHVNGETLMPELSIKTPDGIPESWRSTFKVIDLAIIVASLLGILRFWLGQPPLINIYFGSVLLTLVVVVGAMDWWKLQHRRSHWFSLNLMPLTAMLVSCLGVLSNDSTMFEWVLIGLVFVFMRMPLRMAQWVSLVSIAVSVGIMALQSDASTTVLVRSAVVGVTIERLLSLLLLNFRKNAGQLEHANVMLDASLQNMAQGICVIGKDGRIKLFNKHARCLLDLPNSLPLNDVLASEVIKFQRDRGDLGADFAYVQQESARANQAVRGADMTATSPQRYTRKDRSGRYIEVLTRTMPSGEVVRTYTDISEIEQVNQQLKKILGEYKELSDSVLALGHEQTIIALTELSVIRDNETGLHTKRTQLYVETLAQAMANSGHYSGELAESQIDLFVKATPMHDLGKVGIPDHILLKPGRLTDEEMRIMQTHAALGESILLRMAGKGQADDTLYAVAAQLAGAHHENWDGSGYPRGLHGQEIPLSARLMALADVYDALTTTRTYKQGWEHEDACAEILKLDGIKFDPVIVAAFRQEEARFRAIAEEFRDQPDADQEQQSSIGFQAPLPP